MIRKATSHDIEAVGRSYTEFLMYEKEHGSYTVWQLGVYPTKSVAKKAFAEGSLYIMEQDGELCASVIADHLQPEEYGQIHWKHQAEPNKVLVIHLLCVRPSKAGRGIGSSMVRFLVKQAKADHCRSVRLDTGSQNKPAIALYTKLGFTLAGTAAMSIGGLIPHNNHLFFEISL